MEGASASLCCSTSPNPVYRGLCCCHCTCHVRPSSIPEQQPISFPLLFYNPHCYNESRNLIGCYGQLPAFWVCPVICCWSPPPSVTSVAAHHLALPRPRSSPVSPPPCCQRVTPPSEHSRLLHPSLYGVSSSSPLRRHHRCSPARLRVLTSCHFLSLSGSGPRTHHGPQVINRDGRRIQRAGSRATGERGFPGLTARTGGLNTGIKVRYLEVWRGSF